MEVYFSVACPYCKHMNKCVADVDTQHTTRPMIYACDNEEGGCGHYFAITLRLEPVIKVQTILEELQVYIHEQPEVDELGGVTPD